jgi:NTP pyrophosphatase (non-canonical NTP hydrolase)
MHFNKLTPAEAEILAIVSEEAGEVVQAVGKIARHGLESVPPAGFPTNRQQLTTELGDIQAAIIMLINNQMIDQDALTAARESKLKNISKYLHHAEVDPAR